MNKTSLLVIGGPSSGKTTFRTQLYHRLEHQPGHLQLSTSVVDTTGLQGDVERLVQGLQPMHTNADTYHSTTFSIEDRSRNRLDLEFADYGGEQVQRIGGSNLLSEVWLKRAQNSMSWLVFLRIDKLRPAKNFITTPVKAKPGVSKVSPVASSNLNLEIQSIEIIQRLLFVRGTSTRNQVTSPKLGLFLSCRDELGGTEQVQPPSDLLAHRAPLLSAFLKSNGERDFLRIWGLSSTGVKLPEEKPDQDFAMKGPENSGYIVTDGNPREPDLTIPISWLMDHSSTPC